MSIHISEDGKHRKLSIWYKLIHQLVVTYILSGTLREWDMEVIIPTIINNNFYVTTQNSKETLSSSGQHESLR